MNILFSANIKNRKEANVCNTILDILNRLGNKMFVLTTNNKFGSLLEESYETYHVIDERQSLVDLVLAYNKEGMGQVETIKNYKELPIIALFSASYDYAGQYDCIEKAILLNKTVDYPSILFRSEQVFLWKIPVYLSPNVKYQVNNSRKYRILVAINGENSCSPTIFSIIPCLNKLLNYDIKIVSDINNLPKILNRHIKVIREIKAVENQLLEEVDIVVGCGDIISKAIAFGRPVIVVGERGYGGLVTKDTFQIQYENNFQGRIGGEIGEYISEKLLLDSIFDFAEWHSEFVNKLVKENCKLLKQEGLKQEKAFKDFLLQTIKFHKQIKDDFANINIKLSADWKLVPFSKERFSLVNVLTGYYHSHFEKEEADIIELFRKGYNVKKALKEKGYEEEPALFLEFTRDLVNEKILVSYEN